MPALHPYHAVLALIILAAAGLRLWSIDHGLPYIYNVDEEQHFVPVAAQMVSHHTLNPHYFINPPGLSYVLGAFFTIGWFNSHPGVAFSNDPEPFFLLSRIVVALLCTLAVYLIYRVGRRYDSVATGLIAAAILAVSFVHIWYSKQALDDSVAVTPALAAALFALRGFDGGARRDYIWAGVFAGVAAATKYTSGAVLFSVIAAVLLAAGQGDRRARVKTLLWAGAGAAVAFVILNPYAILDARVFLDALVWQSAGANSSKVGAPDVAPWRYYLWTFTWGIGWVASVSAVAGGIIALRESWRRFVVLAIGPALGLGFLALYERAFARYALPVYPVIAVLAAIPAVRLAARLPAPSAVRKAALAVMALVLIAEGAVAGVRLDQKLGNLDTREQMQRWLFANVPLGTRVAAEPLLPERMLVGTPARKLYTVLTPSGANKFRLTPDDIDGFRAGGTCWVVTQNTWQDRALDTDHKSAIAFKQRLQDESEQHIVFSPWRAGKSVKLNFDWSFDYFPDAFVRPGTYVEIFRLRNCTPSSQQPLGDETWR